MKLFIILLPLLAFGVSSGRETLPFSFLVLLFMGLHHFLKEQSFSMDAPSSTLFAFFIVVLLSVIANLVAPGKFHLSAFFADPMYVKDLKQLFMLSLMILHFLILRKIMKRYDIELLDQILWFFLLVALWAALYSIYQFFALQHNWPYTDILRTSKSYTIIKGKEISNWLGFPRARAFMPESSFWGAFLLIPISLLLPFAFGTRDIRSRFFLAIFLIALLFSFSRTGWFGFLVIALYFLFKHFQVSKKLMNFIRILVPGSILALLLLIFILPGLLPQFTMKLTTFVDFSAFERFRVQKQSFMLFLDHPILGIGWGNTSFYIDSLVTYNFYLQVLLETGIVGFMFFTFFLYQIWHKLIVLERNVKTGPSFYFLHNLILGLKMAFIAILTIWINIPAYNFSYTWFILAYISVLPHVAFNSRFLKEQ
jgi:hypothetical protein